MERADITDQTKIKYHREASAAPTPLSEPAKSFDPLIQSAHWLTLLLMICLFSTAAVAEAGVSDETKRMLIQLHRSFGLTLWIVTILRLTWRQFAEFPDWPLNMPRALEIIMSYGERLLYSLLLLQPILGLLYTNARGNAVQLYFLIRIPPLISQDQELARNLIAVHAFVAGLLLIVIGVHASAMLYRQFVRRDSALNRMLPNALYGQRRQG